MFNDDNTYNTEGTVLVVNGTGKTGRRVVDRLERIGVTVRAGSRSGEPPFDWEDRRTWEPVLRGADAAYVSFYPDVALPGAADTIGAFAALAVENGVRRLVLLSGRGEEEAERGEEALRRSGADWTILRASWFMQNFSESYFRDPLVEGELALPADRVREPFVDADDIADVAVAALMDRRHVGRLYELTGPRALRFDEAVAEIAHAADRPLRYVPLTVAEFRASMAEQDVPPDIVALLAYLFTVVLDGRNVEVQDGVERVLGRPPRDFRDFARAAAAEGAWSAAAVPAP
jgi:uncharacterized protein YbjT (DUF2867 family)